MCEDAEAKDQSATGGACTHSRGRVAGQRAVTQGGNEDAAVRPELGVRAQWFASSSSAFMLLVLLGGMDGVENMLILILSAGHDG